MNLAGGEGQGGFLKLMATSKNLFLAKLSKFLGLKS